MKIKVEEVNVEEFCRICFEHKLDLMSCQNTLVLEDFTCTIEEILSLLSAQKLTEFSTYPSRICLTCKQLVEAAFTLKIMYEKTSETLRNLLTPLENQTKVECKEEDDFEIVDNYFDETNDHEDYANEDKDDNYVDNPEFVEEEIILKFDDEVANTNVKVSSELTDDKSDIRDSEKDDNIEINFKKPENMVHLCPICLKEFFNALEFRTHVQSHKDVQKYLKGKPMLKKSRFVAQHRDGLTIFHKPEPKHTCVYCSQQLPGAELGIHISDHEKKDDFYCKQCDRTFIKLRDFNLHKVRSHRAEFPYKCSECNQGFVVKYNYDCHMLKHTLKEEDLPFACEECPRKFSNSVHLWRHMHIHKGKGVYGSQYKQYRCQICSEYFRNKNVYDQHSQTCSTTYIHDPEKVLKRDFVCKLCGKAYRTHRDLYQHKKSHMHPPRRRECQICGKSVRNLSVHMQVHTGRKQTGPSVCQVCGKNFSMFRNLVRHIESLHTDREPYLCDVCGKSFRHYDGFKAHEKIHIGVKNHLCPVCGKGFLEKSYMKKHMKVHYKDTSIKYEHI